MVIGSGEKSIIDLRNKADEYLDIAYTKGLANSDVTGSIVFKNKDIEIAKEPTGLLLLSGILKQKTAEGDSTDHRWSIEFLPNDGVDAIRDGEEVIDLRDCTMAAQELLALVHKQDEDQAA